MLIQFPETHQDIVIHEDLSGVIWFQASSVCDVLGFSNPSAALENHCPDASKLIDCKEGRGRAALFVSEYGLYLLIMASRKEIGARFRHWLAYEVLPSIRKTGSFGSSADIESQKLTAPQDSVMRLVRDAIELGRSTGLKPERILHLHRQASGEPAPTASHIPAQVATQVKQRRPSKLASDEERLYQLRRVSAKFGGSASAREIAQFCKAAGSTIEAKRWLYDLVGKGLVAAEMVGRCQRFKVL